MLTHSFEQTVARVVHLEHIQRVGTNNVVEQRSRKVIT